MVIGVIILIIALLATFLLWLSGRFLLDLHWLVGWLKGSLGLLMLSASIGFMVVGWDVWHYQTLHKQVAATVSFTRTASRQYDMTLTQNGQTQTVRVTGDLWRAEFLWVNIDPKAGLAASPIYRLQAVQTRYLTLEQEQETGNQRIVLHNPYLGADSWPLLLWVSGHVDLLQPRERLTSYFPMFNGAIFNVLVSTEDVKTEPVNETARPLL